MSILTILSTVSSLVSACRAGHLSIGFKARVAQRGGGEKLGEVSFAPRLLHVPSTTVLHRFQCLAAL